MLGEGIDIFPVRVPKSLAGKTLGESEIGARTGLSVVAIRKEGDMVTNPSADEMLEEGGEFLLIGNAEQRQVFNAKYS
jgi:K+/H+ antiporter YhaU regulatory subunit KhtT